MESKPTLAAFAVEMDLTRMQAGYAGGLLD